MPPKRLRIAVLTRNFSRTAGGAESYAISIAQELSLRHHVHVFCQETDRPVHAAAYHLIARPCRRPRWINQIFYAVATWWQTRHGFDVVHSHEHVFHGQIQTLHVQPVAHGVWGERQGWRKALRWLSVLTSPRRLTYLALEAARTKPIAGRQLVFASAPLLDRFKLSYPGIQAISHIIEPGVALPDSPADRQACRQQLGWAAQAHWLLFVANDYQRKGLDAVLQALSQLPDAVQLAVVGQARQQPLYASKARAWGVADRVTFFGPRQDIEVFMTAADVLVHPTWEDSFGMVVLEAMAAGLPVIVSCAPYCGLSADLRHLQEAWLLDDPGDSSQLATALQTLLKDAALRQHLGASSLGQARSRTWSSAALKYEKIMQP